MLIGHQTTQNPTRPCEFLFVSIRAIRGQKIVSSKQAHEFHKYARKMRTAESPKAGNAVNRPHLHSCNAIGGYQQTEELMTEKSGKLQRS
jgi:hypothetical protein